MVAKSVSRDSVESGERWRRLMLGMVWKAEGDVRRKGQSRVVGDETRKRSD